MATDFDTGRHQYQSYRYCYDNGHQQWLEKAAQCFRFWNGEQWDKLIKARLDNEGRPALTFNIIESLIRAMEGMQCALRNDVRFTPVYDANTDSARVQDAIWLHIQNDNSFDFLETDVYKKGLIMARAYYDVRVDYDDSFQGNVKITSPRSQDIILDPSSDGYDSASWPQVFKRRWVSYNDIKNLFGKDKAEAIAYGGAPSWLDYEDNFMAQQMGALPYYRDGGLEDESLVRAYMMLDRQYREVKTKEVFVDLLTGDFSEIPETWDRNRVAHVLESVPDLSTTKRKMNTVRWDITCEGTPLFSADSPYNDFTIVPFFPNFVDGVSKGAVESLIDPQQLYNKITSQELHIINTTANSGLVVRRGAVKNMDIDEMESFGSKSGVVFEVDDIETALKKITPNATPQGHDRLSFKADAIMRSMAGVSDQGRGFAREDVSSKALLANQAAQDINAAGWLSNLHRTKQLLARRVQDCVRTTYTEERVILINRGSIFSPQTEEMTINQQVEGQVLNNVTRGKYTTVLVPAPSRATMTEGDFKLLLELRTKVGVAIPDALLLELSPASNKSEIIASLQGDSNERQRAAEEAEAQKNLVEQEKATATARKEEAAATLNTARAEKAAVEARTDPDAAYTEVEMSRIETDNRQFERRLTFDYDKLAQDGRQHAEDTALELTKVDVQSETADKAAKAKAQQKPAAPANKSGKTKR